ncbi:MAG: hypothetical protein Q8S21_01060 [Candidatus Paracaedibacteraceae bacterium]|nr:hypothetical protein [Candidatus Paracaedibacteraceae bacterium]
MKKIILTIVIGFSLGICATFFMRNKNKSDFIEDVDMAANNNYVLFQEHNKGTRQIDGSHTVVGGTSDAFDDSSGDFMGSPLHDEPKTSFEFRDV